MRTKSNPSLLCLVVNRHMEAEEIGCKKIKGK